MFVPPNGSEGYRERLEPAEHRGLTPLRSVRDELERRHPTEQRADGNLPLDAGQGGAQAKVNTEAEGDVPVVLSRDVEALGVGEVRWVAIGGANGRDDDAALGDLFATDLDIRHGHARRPLHRAVVAQELLDARLDQRGVIRALSQ